MKEKKKGKGLAKGKGKKKKLILEDSDSDDGFDIDDEFRSKKNNCLTCEVDLNDRKKCKMSVQCDICDGWCCLMCSEMTAEELETSDFYCKKCVPR